MDVINNILDQLPPYSNKRVIISQRQSVNEIMREVLTAHRMFSNDYDKICVQFWAGNVYDTCKGLWNFCKKNIPYNIQDENNQQIKSPAAILTHAAYTNEKNDCKQFANFIGGVLDGLTRRGKKINWFYRFASYNGNTPEHVFIVVKHNGREIWIDPVLKSFDERLQPNNVTDKKIKMLTRISGIGDTSKTYPVSDMLEAIDNAANPGLYMAVQLLLKHGIINANAKINAAAVNRYKSNPQLFAQLTQALAETNRAAISGFFDDIWRAVKVVTLAPMRGAYLSIVAVNGFGYATKLKAAIYNSDGTFTKYKDAIKNLWQDKLGGQFSVLLNTVNNGATKKAILGNAPRVGVVITLAAWAAAAATIIAALTPIITTALKSKPPAEQISLSVDPVTGLPYGAPPPPSNDPLEWIKNNPMIVAGGLAAIYFLTKKKRAA